MNKLFVTLLITAFAASASAQSKVITNPEEMAPYVEATQRELSRTNKSLCSVNVPYKTWDMNSMVRSASSITISDGQQPLLIFTTVKKENVNLVRGIPNAVKAVLTISTSPDFKVITRAMIQVYKKERANVGDLKNPKIEEIVVLDPDFTCVN